MCPRACCSGFSLHVRQRREDGRSGGEGRQGRQRERIGLGGAHRDQEGGKDEQEREEGEEEQERPGSAVERAATGSDGVRQL